ncbi:TPA: DNA modification methylase, partial [candidate division WOR-3 bacterium]|nr:DNA modification methylase [candidate division WOR-3 bacterium]
DVKKRLESINFYSNLKAEIDISMFYHPNTESEIVSLKKYLCERKISGKEDFIDRWIRMVATNRLTGHSKNFFSIYTLPPNQAISPERQKKLNIQSGQQAEYKNIKDIILIKSRNLLKDIDQQKIKDLSKIAKEGIFLSKDARKSKDIKDETVNLIVTSPPFLDVIQYADDNWLRCWFNDIDINDMKEKITVLKKLEDWTSFMRETFKEFYRIVKTGGWVAFEVGEVKNGKIKLDEVVVPIGIDAGFSCEGVMINSQIFSKTSNCWGVSNNTKGTNTNRIVIFKKG